MIERNNSVKTRGRSCLLFASLLWLVLVQVDALAHGEKLVWGTSAVTLNPAYTSPPSMTELLADKKNTVSLGRFYRAGGENLAVTPTECRVAHDADNLFVIFHCVESNMAFPAIDHGVDWFSQIPSPSEQDAAFPDKVDLFILPDVNKAGFYQFAVTMDGQKFGVKRHTGSQPPPTDGEAGTSAKDGMITTFEASVSRKEKQWDVVLKIPWQTIGGRPASTFGLVPARTRWRNAEVSSPVAGDFSERPPLDLYIETRFPGIVASTGAPASLCRLPSGILRWQRAAWLSYPDAETCAEIWRLQQSLPEPTSGRNFARRVHLTQRWTDLLTLEGFNFRVSTGSIVEQDLLPFVIRHKVNAALRKDEQKDAYQLLDDYLGQLDKVSRKWFADGSPGDILKNEWKAISELRGLEVKGRVLVMHCLAADKIVDLHLALPNSGGVRIYANHEGYFKPDSLAPIHLRNTTKGHAIDSPAGRIEIHEKPFRITFYNPAGKVVTQIDPGCVAFRFSPEGKVLAVDFKNRLDKNEVIYGFGEKYDHFNQNGNVLTLWGVDDWTGLTVGLRNQSYKPVPIIHSSKGYTIFVNSSYRLRADVGRARPDQCRLTQHGPVFDYYIWIGPPEQSLESYTRLTGKPFLPPKWAFEPWMGRTGRGWNNTELHDPVAEQERVAERFAKLDIPHSAIYAEGVGADTPALYDFMGVRGIKVVSWFYPVIPQSDQRTLLPEMTLDQLPVLNIGGSSNFPGKDIDYVDFTHPNAMELSRRWWKRRLDLGLAGSMVDFGDRVPEEAIFHNGQKGEEMHNFYSYAYQKTYHDVFEEKRANDFILFGRAAAPGTQKWAGQFAGDHRCNFMGLQSVLNGALNLCACGFSTWGSDLGGFLGWPEPAVYMRWTQFACFSPLMRSHGRTPREPWEFGESAVANYKHYAWVRENLLDYIYNAAVNASTTGIPIMRAMAVAYPKEPSLAGVNDQYLFGEYLLAAPVTTEDNFRTIVFPPGKWTSLWDGKVVSGPDTIKISVPLDTIPVFLREGAVVPVRLSRNLQFGESLTSGHIDALVVTPPGMKEEISLLNFQDKSASAMMRPITNGFAMTLNNFPGMRCVLAYGPMIMDVKVDGEVLPKLAADEYASSSPGWCEDPKTKRAVIHLPPAKAGVADSGGKIELEFEMRIR